MIEDLGFDDKRLSTDLRLGFPLKGVLPPCVYNTVETLVSDQAFVTETEEGLGSLHGGELCRRCMAVYH